jgi:imidazolonepropionase-like amidohydrolase
MIRMGAIACLLGVFATMASGQETPTPRILFTNVHVFDGVSAVRIENAEVLVEGNLVAEVSTEALPRDGAQVIDGGGRTLMPGLMDAHVHLALVRRPDEIRNDVDWMYVGALANEEAEAMLMRGFTTVRDVGGPTVGLHRAIEQGEIIGPRIFSSGPFITQTSGHGDLRNYNELHPQIYGETFPMDQQGWLIIADGPDEVTRAVREALRMGARQIKMMAGGAYRRHSIRCTRSSTRRKNSKRG